MGKIIYNDLARNTIKRSIDYLADAVKVTLGPRGKTVVLFREDGTSYLTKDGVSVAKNIKGSNNQENIGIQMIKEVAINTAKEVGDATTTSIVLAQTIINNGLDYVNKGYDANLVKEGMNKALADVLKEIKKYSSKIKSDSQLNRIATISANNDSTVGSIITEAIKKAGKYGIIKLEQSPTYETFIDVTQGFKLNRGYLSSCFINHIREQKCIFEDPLVYLFNKDLNVNSDIVPVLQEACNKNKPIVIIANDFSNRVLDIMRTNNYKGNVQILPIKTPGYGVNKELLLKDIAALVGIKEVSSTFNPENFGTIDKIVSSVEDTIIYNKPTDESFDEYIVSLSQFAETIPDKFQKESLQERIALLTNGIITIYVGAASELEAKEKYDRVEDALCATKAALEEGVVVGGGIVFKSIYETLNGTFKGSKEVTAGYNSVIWSLYSPFARLCDNAEIQVPEESFKKNEGIDFKTLEKCDLKKRGILDPTKALIVALTNAISVASMVISTQCIVIND